MTNDVEYFFTVYISHFMSSLGNLSVHIFWSILCLGCLSCWVLSVLYKFLMQVFYQISVLQIFSLSLLLVFSLSLSFPVPKFWILMRSNLSFFSPFKDFFFSVISRKCLLISKSWRFPLPFSSKCPVLTLIFISRIYFELTFVYCVKGEGLSSIFSASSLEQTTFPTTNCPAPLSKISWL